VVEPNPRRLQLSEQAPASSLPGMRFFSRSLRLRTLDEASAYSRCHSDRSDAILLVRAAKPKPPQPYPYRGHGRVSGEEIRRRLEELLDARQKP